MENYREKFEKHIKNSKFEKLDKKSKEFLTQKAYKYRFTFMELK